VLHQRLSGRRSDLAGKPKAYRSGLVANLTYVWMTQVQVHDAHSNDRNRSGSLGVSGLGGARPGGAGELVAPPTGIAAEVMGGGVMGVGVGGAGGGRREEVISPTLPTRNPQFPTQYPIP